VVLRRVCQEQRAETADNGTSGCYADGGGKEDVPCEFTDVKSSGTHLLCGEDTS